MKLLTQKRVLALNVRPHSFAFVVFDGPSELVDWGIKSFRHGVNAVKVPMSTKMALVLDQCRPDVVVLNEAMKGAPNTTIVMSVKLAKNRRIPVRRISRDDVRKMFPRSNSNKYQIATVVAARFQELLPRLGLRRKVWEAEKYSMGIFEAAALGITYFTRGATTDNDNDRTLSTLPR